MATVTRGESVNAAKTIRDETRARGNTRSRVGQMLVDLAESAAFTADTYAGATGFTVRGMYVDVGAGVNIARFTDRVFIGDAATQLSGNFIGGTTTSFTAAVPGNSWMERDAQFVSSHQNGMIAIAGTSRSDRHSTYDSSAQACIGVLGAAVNTNSATSSGPAWAGYFEAVTLEGTGPTSAGIFGLEIVAKDMRVGGSPVPHAYYAGTGELSVGAWFQGGGDPTTGVPGGPSGVAIMLGANGDTWLKGIIIQANAIEGSDGETGGQRSVAIGLALDHEINWRSKNFGAELPNAGAGIRYIGGGNAAFIRQLFENRTFRIALSVDDTVANEKAMFECVGPAAGATANFVRCTSVASGSGVTVSAQGTDSNIDLQLSPKGTGILKDGASAPCGGPRRVTKTIASDAITIATSEHVPILSIEVDTEAAAASDNLATITGGYDGMVIILRQVNDSRDVVVKHGTSMFLPSSADYTLTSRVASIVLQRQADGAWLEISRTTS